MSEYTKQLEKILQLPVQGRTLWNVYAYILNSDVTPDMDLYGLLIPLGGFSTYEKAKKHAQEIVEKSCFKGVVVAQYGSITKLTKVYDPDHVQPVIIDAETGEMVKTYLDEANEKPTLPTQWEEPAYTEYQRSWYRAVKYRAQVEYLTHELNTAKEVYEKNLQEIRDHLTKHPEDKGEQWLHDLQPILAKKKEEILYKKIVEGYKLISPEL